MTRRGLAAIATGLLLGACQQSPAAVCSDKTNIRGVQNLLEELAIQKTRSNAEYMVSPKYDGTEVKTAVDNVGIDNILPISDITVQDVDNQTRKIVCEAKVHIKVPNDKKWSVISDYYALHDVTLDNGEADIDVDYTIQPSASGNGTIYHVMQGDKLANIVAIVGRRIYTNGSGNQ